MYTAYTCISIVTSTYVMQYDSSGKQQQQLGPSRSKTFTTNRKSYVHMQRAQDIVPVRPFSLHCDLEVHYDLSCGRC